MAKLQDQITTSFANGMHDSAAPTAFPPATCALLLNARIQPDGSVRRRWGTIKTSSSVPNAGTGYGGAWFKTAAGAVVLVVFCGAKAYKSTDYGANWTELATGLRQDYYDFAVLREGASNWLLCANGDTTIKKYDGSTWGTVANAPSGVPYVEAFNRRVYASGHSGVLVQASAIGDYETWASPDGLTVQVRALPTGMYQLGRHLLVFDEDATSYVDGYGEQTLIVAAGETGLSRSVGCAAFRSIVGIGDSAVAWLSKRGVELYSEGRDITLLSKSVQKFLQSIDWEETYPNPGRPSACYDALEQDYLLALSTNGTRNDRVLVLNMRQGELDEREGKLAAPSVDRLQSPDAGDTLFGIDGDGYLDIVAGGSEMEVDGDGYLSLVEAAESGDPMTVDADGYLDIVTNDTLPATLFSAPSSTLPSVVYSVGYDGWVRRHYGVDSDDMDSDETGGEDVAMTVRSKPYLLRNPRRRKRVRKVHIASLQESAATINVSVKGAGKQTGQQSLAMAGLGTDVASRKPAQVWLDADNPQVELTSTDDVRVSLIGISAEILRDEGR